MKDNEGLFAKCGSPMPETKYNMPTASDLTSPGIGGKIVGWIILAAIVVGVFAYAAGMK